MSGAQSLAILAVLAAFYLASIWYGLKLAKWLSKFGERQIDKWMKP